MMTVPGATPESPSGPVFKPQAPERPSAPELKADLWRSYELAQQHYEMDLQLFSVRMNLFLIIQSGLFAVVGSAARIGTVKLAADRGAVAAFGLALAAAWLLVAISSYLWVKTWRAHMIQLGDRLNEHTSIDVSGRFFEHARRRDSYERAYSHKHRFWQQLEWLSWYVRPTLVTCCLPLLFIGGWIYLGWYS
jgi:hypothetical protein